MARQYLVPAQWTPWYLSFSACSSWWHLSSCSCVFRDAIIAFSSSIRHCSCCIFIALACTTHTQRTVNFNILVAATSASQFRKKSFQFNSIFQFHSTRHKMYNILRCELLNSWKNDYWVQNTTSLYISCSHVHHHDMLAVLSGRITRHGQNTIKLPILLAKRINSPKTTDISILITNWNAIQYIW